jgi:hypothetical protein
VEVDLVPKFSYHQGTKTPRKASTSKDLNVKSLKPQ